MVTNQSLTIYFCLIMIVMLSFIYFSKTRINNEENKVYKTLLISNIVGLCLQLVCEYISYNQSFLPKLVNFLIYKFFMIYFVFWLSIMLYYLIVIAFDNYKKLFKYIKIIIISSSILLLLLPYDVYCNSITRTYYTYGIALNFTYIVSIILIFILCLILVTRFKKISKSKVLPVFLFIILGIMGSLFQLEHKGIVLLTIIESLISFLMYHTIENPDMKMIEQLNVERDRADKANKAKTDFLSNMSHEIRTPLNAIVGFSELLGEENLPESSKSLVSDIIISSENLIEIVNGVLDISKIEADKLEIISTEYEFKKIFDEMVLLAKGRLGDKGLEFLYEYDESIPPFLYGDAARIKQIGVNLLTNAIKYTKEGSVKFNISSVINNNVCRLIMSVEDTGIGIKREDIDKLFTKFERLGVERNTTVEGTGLGLAICKKLIELMGGKIYVQSVFGKGSKFTAVIDQKIVKGKTKEEVKPLVIDSSKIAGKKVLVVDDNELNIKVATRLLAKFNLDIDSVNSGALCIEKVNSNKYDLILLDDMMPKMSGTDTLIELKKINEFSTPTVVLTANAISGMREKYLSSGFDDYLSKPIENKELNRVIQKYLS